MTASKLHEFWRFSKHTDPIDPSLKLSTTGAFGCELGWPWVIGEQMTEQSEHMAVSHAHPASIAEVILQIMAVEVFLLGFFVVSFVTDLIWFSFWTCFIRKKIPRLFDHQHGCIIGSIKYNAFNLKFLQGSRPMKMTTQDFTERESVVFFNCQLLTVCNLFLFNGWWTVETVGGKHPF